MAFWLKDKMKETRKRLTELASVQNKDRPIFWDLRGAYRLLKVVQYGSEFDRGEPQTALDIAKRITNLQSDVLGLLPDFPEDLVDLVQKQARKRLRELKELKSRMDKEAKERLAKGQSKKKDFEEWVKRQMASPMPVVALEFRITIA